MERSYNGWEPLFSEQFCKDYFKTLKSFLSKEYATRVVYPPKKLILNAFDVTSPQDVKVVIIGQDPYINKGQAMGMSFSVPEGQQPPPSLLNIFKEIANETGRPSIVKGGDLTVWAKQGVLLLNSVLTVEAGKSNSHKDKGWEIFTDSVIKFVNDFDRPVVFMLWGANAKQKQNLITNPIHCVLTAAHPSPLSAYNGFFGCGHFVKANDFLEEHGATPVVW